MQKTMQKHAAVFRDSALMAEGVAKLAEANKRLQMSKRHTTAR